MMRIFLGLSIAAFALASCMTSTTNGERCPIFEDLTDAEGIVLTRNSPNLFQSKFTIEGGFLIEHRIMERQGIGRETIYQKFYNTFFVTDYQRTYANGSEFRIRQTFDKPQSKIAKGLSDFPRSSTFQRSVNNNPSTNIRMEIAHHGDEVTSIGNCSYKTKLLVQTTYKSGRIFEAAYLNYYAPELGISLKVVKLDQSGNAISQVTFDSIK